MALEDPIYYSFVFVSLCLVIFLVYLDYFVTRASRWSAVLMTCSAMCLLQKKKTSDQSDVRVLAIPSPHGPVCAGETSSHCPPPFPYPLASYSFSAAPARGESTWDPNLAQRRHSLFTCSQLTARRSPSSQLMEQSGTGEGVFK